MNIKLLASGTVLIVQIFMKISVFAQNENLDEIYKNSFRQNIPRSMQEIPFEDSDYHKKHYSPYSLVIIPRTCKYDKDIIKPGFYLVKPFSENGVDYLIFKKEGIAVAVVPVTEKEEYPKKVKKMKVSLIEGGHGSYFIVIVRHHFNSYAVKLDVVD